jgi:O-antigen/teichoic acid export membrane protein
VPYRASVDTAPAVVRLRARRTLGTMLAHRRNRKIIASAGFGVFQRLVQVGSTLVLMPVLLRVLGPAHFGVWGAAASLAWMAGLADIGIGTALVTMVAQSVARNDLTQARDRVASALSLGSLLAAVMLFGAFVARMFGALQGDAAPYLIAVVGLALNIPLNSANNVWMSLQKGYVSGFWELAQTVLTTAALLVAIGFTHDVRILVALVYGGLVVANLGSFIHLLWLHPELRPAGLLVPSAALREVATNGSLFFVLGITGGLSFMLDNVLALQLLGPEASARMTIAMRICMAAVGMLIALSQPFWPAFVEAAHHADRKWIRRGVLQGTAFLLAVTGAGSLVLVFYGEKLLQLWLHTTLGIGAGLLLAISAWILTQALIRLPTLLLNALSLVRFEIVVFAIATIVAFTLKFALAPKLGVSGILWGTSVTVALIAVPASLRRIYRWANASARSGISVPGSLAAGRDAQSLFR